MPRMSGAGGQVVRFAVLRDYPLRLWAEQNEHFEGLLREFSLLLIGERSAELHRAAPGRLVELADFFGSRFGGLLQTINDERRAALDSGADRMDSRVIVPPDAPALLDRVRSVLEETDEFCRGGELLSLPGPPHLIRFGTWAGTEIIAQHGGADPTPWPGPF